MRSRVIHEAARGFTRVGAATLRFNFRGVGLSAGAFDSGVGETADFRAAVDEMAARYPNLRLWAAGYSFGAWIATTVCATDERIKALVAIAPLVDRHDYSSIVASPKPKFFIHGERDQFCSPQTLRRFYAQMAEPRELVIIDAADHVFDGKASEVGDAIADLLTDFE
jgi:alpha/beta superfamily hydrolase